MKTAKSFDIVLLSNPPSTHLKEIFEDIPKIFIPFFDSFLLDYYLYYFKHFNLRNIFIIFYETNSDIVDFYLGSWFPENFIIEMELNIFRENKIIGNIGAIKEIESYISNDNIIVFNTGAVPKFNIDKAIDFHKLNENDVTIIIHKKNFKNKDIIPDTYCFIIKKELLNLVPKGKYTDFKNRFLSIIKEKNLKYDFYLLTNEKLFSFLTFEDYINLIKEIIKSPATYVEPMLNDFMIDSKSYSAVHKKTYNKASEIESSVIGRSCIIKKNAYIKESIISDNVIIGERATIEKSFIKAGTAIENDKFIASNFDSINIRSLLESSQVKDKPWERVFDLFLLFCSLPITIPLIIIVSLIVLIAEGKPVLYIQKRIGKNGKPFKMIKFRTMRKDADEFKNKIKDLNEIDGPMFKISNDPRITKIGKFLRKTSLDELPQLLNILKGEMSFVGPRPLEEKEMSLHPQWRDLRLKVKPGLTGLWQVMKSKNESFSEWIQYDTYYITHKSPFLYFKIIFLTFLSVIKSKNK